ncbi:MAG: hypothetical protein ACW97A_00335 [Candidatus Thorarchaeota archaeon]|jgi:hypothetical protein
MMKTLQIATVAEDTDVVMVGIRNVPTHKLVLICLPSNKDYVEQHALELERMLRIDVEVQPIHGEIIEGVLDVVAGILKENRSEFDEVVLNVAGGEKALTCAAVSAAFFNGLKAFHLMDDVPIMLPVLKMRYDKMVSDTKVNILRTLQSTGGEVESLGHLCELSGYGKPLISYHLNGTEDSSGLINLGFVDVERRRQGRLHMKLTTLGKALLLGLSGSN